jgi:hypothetical protein
MNNPPYSQMFALALVCAIGTLSCCATVSKRLFYGDMKQIKGLELYYSSDVPESQLSALGAFLIRTGFTQDVQSSARISKSGDVYVFQMVIKPGMDYMQYEFFSGTTPSKCLKRFSAIDRSAYMHATNI